MKDPPSDFKIMRVVVRSALPDTKYADAYDEFGEKIPAHTEKGKGYIRTITIDRKPYTNEYSKQHFKHNKAKNHNSTSCRCDYKGYITNNT